jgi:hypothetical protein
VPASSASSVRPRRRPFYLIPIWAGIGALAWWRLLARHGFAVHWGRLALLVYGSVLSLFNSALAPMQSAMLPLRRREAKDPIFILGHWRSGTTLLHELLTLDPQFGFPSSYACFAPGHFLVTERVLGPLVQILSPRRRPQDDMRWSVERPQEDEFALLAYGIPSPYAMFMFPRRDTPDLAYLDFDGVPAAGVDRWRRAHRRFLRALAWRDPRPAILKSPPHTARLRVLADAYPRARFVHIVRDPRAVIPSTRNMIEALAQSFGLQPPDRARIHALAFALHDRLHRALERAVPHVDADRFHELRYEDLVADPQGEIRRLYAGLKLAPSEITEAGIARYLDETKGFKPARHTLSDDERREIETRCEAMMLRYGYASKAPPA